MTDIDVEVTELTDAGLRKRPRCSCLSTLCILYKVRRRWHCRRKSSVHMRIHCTACGKTDTAFLCRVHALLFRQGHWVSCRFCNARGKCRSAG